MAKLTLTDVSSGYTTTTTINANNALIEAALENTLSRDGTSPNQMSADIDLNGHGLLNVGSLTFTGSGLTDQVGYAEEWASKAEDSLISTAAGGNGVDEYSALHWASKAADSSTAASSSASAASSAATAAALSETNAATSEANAADSETAAAASAADAATSEANAADSAATAAAAVSTHSALTTGVHGVTGTVVGTSDAQTLTNKTMSFGGNTISCTFAELNTAVSDATLLSTTSTLQGGDRFQVDTWFNSADSNQRINFQDGAETVIKGHGATPIQLRNSSDTNILTLDSSGNATLTGGVSATSVSGNQVASVAEMETASATDKVVTPGRVIAHPGVAKAWVVFDSAGSVSASYGVSSITDNGTGDFTVNFSTAFSSTSYASFINVNQFGTSNRPFNGAVQSNSTTLCNIAIYDSTDTLADPALVYYMAFGDQ